MEILEADQAVLSQFSDWRHGLYPPIPVVAAALSLRGTAEIRYACGNLTVRDRESRWNLLAATDTHLIQVLAVAEDAGLWDWESQSSVPHTLSSSRRRLEDISTVAVTSTQQLANRAFRRDVRWCADYSVTFRDGATILLPSATEATSQPERDAAESFATHVLAVT